MRGGLVAAYSIFMRRAERQCGSQLSSDSGKIQGGKVKLRVRKRLFTRKLMDFSEHLDNTIRNVVSML